MQTKPELSQTVPLSFTESGAIRIADTRVTLESVIYHFNLGATAEQIVHKFPALNLTDVYLVLAYYLANRAEVDKYFQQQDAKATAARMRLEADPTHRVWKAELRERLLARNRKSA